MSVRDARIARIVRRCRDLPGQELFQYVAEDGSVGAIGSADVNVYIREATGEEFTAKDFRTWAGTVLASVALREEAADGRRPNNAQVVRAIKRVAAQLGNTPSVCRKSYVHPEVISAFLDGELGGGAARSTGAASATSAVGLTRLSPTESAALSLLRRRLATERKGGDRLARQLRRSLRLVR